MARPRTTGSPARPRPRPGRSRPSTAVAPARARTIAAAQRVPWRRDPTIAAITTEILGLQGSACSELADVIVEIGRRLHAARERLEFGEWLDWIASAVPFTHDSAKSYMKLADFAREEPDEYARMRRLGPTKLYVVMALPRERRRRLQLSRTMLLPSGRRKSIETMTVVELADHLGDLALPPAPARPIGKVVRAVRFRVAGLGAAMDLLVARKGEVDEAVAREIAGELRTIAGELERAFGV